MTLSNSLAAGSIEQPARDHRSPHDEDAGPLDADPRYRAALEQMQKSDWEKAGIMLRHLLTDYPGATELNDLLQQVEFKTDLDSEWGQSVQGRRFSFTPTRLLGMATTVGVVLVLLFGGLYLYRNVLLPQRAANALAMERQAVVEEAEYALQSGQYDKAIALYEQALIDAPDDPALVQGLSKAQQQLSLETEYNAAMAALEAGDEEAAFEQLSAIEEKAPGYRDVALQLAQMTASGDAEELFANANLALHYQKWSQAAAMYEELRRIDGEFEAEAVADALFEANFAAGMEAISRSPDDGGDPALAQEYFRKALTLRVGDEAARRENDLLSAYFAGQRALASENLEQAAAILEPIQAERPDYLGGHVSQLLYETFLTLGDRALRDGDRLEAFGFFGKAAGLNGVDTGEAELRLDSLAVLLTPTPTPTLTPTPAPALPTPTPPPLDWFRGWIAFKSNRDGGSAIYVMRPDGSEQQVVGAGAFELYDELYKAEQWSPDGNTRVYAEKSKESVGGVDLFKFRHDLPDTWERRLRITDFPGDEYDPVWSPNNEYIAFVSNTTGNDEIWTVRTDDTDHEQITWNTWEWDKHPSWSPDSTQIVFHSNRTGALQIWLMNMDGSDPHNLSNNAYEDWDPIWIK